MKRAATVAILAAIVLTSTFMAHSQAQETAGEAKAAEAVKVQLVLGNWLPADPDHKQSTATRSQSPLQEPFGVDFDGRGNMTLVELGGGRVFRLDPAGRLAQIAGDGSKSYRGDGGPAKNATFNGMHNVAVTPNGNIYIADSWNHCIRLIDPTGKIQTVAGTGQAGFGGDGGPAPEATFDFVMCITLNAANDKLYIADLKNRRIRMMDLKTNRVTTVAGNGQRGVPKDGAQALDSPLVDPRAVTVDSKNRIYILERGGNALRRVDVDGTIQTVAGNGQRGYRDGPALQAQFGSPKHVCVDDADNLYIADDLNRAIRKFDPRSSTVTTVVGRGHGQPRVELSHPHGVCIQRGTLFVVDTGNNRVFKVK